MRQKTQYAQKLPADSREVLLRKVASMLSLARKAGKLTAGADMVKDAVQTGQVQAVFTAADLSSKSLKEVEYACGQSSVPVFPLGIAMDEIAPQIGRRSGILAVSDPGFEAKIRSLLEEIKTAPGEEETEPLSRKESC